MPSLSLSSAAPDGWNLWCLCWGNVGSNENSLHKLFFKKSETAFFAFLAKHSSTVTKPHFHLPEGRFLQGWDFRCVPPHLVYRVPRIKVGASWMPSKLSIDQAAPLAFLKTFIFCHVCVWAWIVYTCTGALRGQKRMLPEAEDTWRDTKSPVTLPGCWESNSGLPQKQYTPVSS